MGGGGVEVVSAATPAGRRQFVTSPAFLTLLRSGSDTGGAGGGGGVGKFRLTTPYYLPQSIPQLTPPLQKKEKKINLIARVTEPAGHTGARQTAEPLIQFG